MARRKRGSGKGYTNQYGLNLSKQQYEKYTKAVRNYNRRIQRAYNKIGELDILPKKVSPKEQLEKFVDKRSVTQFIKDLESITSKNLVIVGHPKTGEAITKGELDLIRRRIKRENARRARIKKLVGKQQEEIGFFKTDNDKILMPIDENKYSSIESLRKASEKFTGGYQERLAIAWRDRYLNRIEYNIQQAIVAGMDPSGNIITKLERIKGYVESLRTLSEITRAAYGAPEMDITVIYYEDMSEPIVEEIYNAWDEFMDGL